MTEQIGASGEGLLGEADENKKIGDPAAGANSAGIEDAADSGMAVTDADNYASGAADAGAEAKTPHSTDGQQPQHSMEQDALVAEDIENKNNANNKENETPRGVSVNINDKEPEDINQFDSVSNAMSQSERLDLTKQPFTRKDALQLPQQTEPKTPTPRSKKVRKGIFISYSPDAGFMERKFVVETVKQLKENNLAEDIWFDKDEENTGSACWFSLRMETVEKCKAAVVFLSDSYFTCPVSVYEGKTLLERTKSNPHSVAIFPVLFTPLEKSEPPKEFQPVVKAAVDLTGEHFKLSLAEKSSVVVGTIMETLEKFACMNLPLGIPVLDNEFTGEYKKKKICQWSVSDLQEWLYKLGIKEFYRQSLAENVVDGFLLMSLTDHDMINSLGIDSRVVRKKIMQNILLTLDKEHKHVDNWHLRARAQRAKSDVVYLVYDPADVRLAQNIKMDLRKKNVQIIHHDSMKLGRSKDEFLEINGPQMATAAHVIVLLSDTAGASPFVFHEVLFADWLGKKIVSIVFKNIWFNLRASLKAVLGDCPAIDFETKMYNESLDVLEHHIKPLRRVPGVVLEQSYLNKMADGLKPLETLAYTRNGIQEVMVVEGDPKVFISYQWDMQAKVENIKQVLEANGLPCWADINMAPQPNRGHSSRSVRSSATHDTAIDTLQSLIQRNMKASSVVLTCITPKYLQSDNCKKDLTLAEMFNKPIIPVLLRYSPLESAPDQIRKILARLSYIDLSNERLYKQNVGLVVEKIKKHVTQH